MNKKVLSAILFSALFAGTGTFTSCIDTDEPAGIENLRGAKAELIRAKVAVEAANAAYVQAEAAYKLAQAENEKAQARWTAACAAKAEAEAEQAAAKTEADKAYYELQIAKYNKELQEIAVALKESLADKEKALAKAEFELEVALKQIEVAKALGLSDFKEATISNLEGKVKEAYQKLYGKDNENGLGGLVGKVYDAEKELYEAMLDKAAGLEKGNQDAYIPELELKVARKEANVVAKEEALAKLQEFLEKDTETTDWRAEIAELEAEIEALKKAITEKGVEIVKAKNSPEALETKQAWQGVYEEGKSYDNGDAPIKNGTVQELEAAIKKHNKYADEKELKLSAIEVKPNAELVQIIADAVADYNAEAEVDVTSWNTGKFAIAKQTYHHPYYNADGEDKTVADETLAQVNAILGALGVAEISEEELKWAEQQKEAKEEAVEDAQEAYDAALASWGIAQLAMEGTKTDIPATETAKVTTAITAYNTAVAALAAKVEAYNTTHDEVYQAAYDAAVASEYNKVYWSTFKDKATTSLANALIGYEGGDAGKISTLITSIETLNKDNYTAMIAALEDYYVAKDASVAANVTNVAKMKSDDKEAARKKAETQKIATDNWETVGVPAGNTALADAKLKKDAINSKGQKLTADGTLAAAQTAIETAVKALYEVKDGKTIGAYKAMTDAFAAYLKLASDEYAQVQTEDAAKIALPAAPASNVWANAKDADDNGFVYWKSNAVAMDETKVAGMMALELDEALAETALLNTSNKAFGIGGTQGRLTLPTDEQVLDGALNNDADATNDGAKYTLIKANEALKKLNDQLAQQDNLDKAIADVTAAKTALEAEIAANNKLFETYHANIKAADAANTAAEKAYNAIETEITLPLQIEEAKLVAERDAAIAVKDEVEDAVNTHLGIDDIDYDYESFEDELKAAVEVAEDKVIEAEKELALAKKDLQLAQEGKYDAVATAQRELDAANAAMEKAMKEYNEALTNLETALAIMAGETAE